MRIPLRYGITLAADVIRPHVAIRAKPTHTIYEGGSKPSKLIVPLIPR